MARDCAETRCAQLLTPMNSYFPDVNAMKAASLLAPDTRSVKNALTRAFFTDFPYVASAFSVFGIAAGSPPSLRDGDLLRLHRSPYCLRARSSGKSTEKCSSSRRFLLLIGAWLLASTANAQGALSPEQKILPVVHLSVGAYSVKAEIAENDADRARGLMFRTFLKPDNGMLFVFDRTDQYCFWMRNTKIPLSIAFIDEAGIIANMDEMQPGTLNSHCPVRPVRYALEMNSGWYASKDVKPGTKIDGLPRR